MKNGPLIRTSVLTRYSCEDFPSRTTRNCLLLRKEEIKPNSWPEIPFKFVKNNNEPKALDISSTTAPVVPDLLKVLAILSETTVKRSVVDQDLKLSKDLQLIKI